MQTFWRELGFWWKRQVKGWNLVGSIPLNAVFTYLLVDSIRTSLVGIRISRHLHQPADEFYTAPALLFSLWLGCLMLTLCKAVSLLWPEPEPPFSLPRVKGAADGTIWPPPPKP